MAVQKRTANIPSTLVARQSLNDEELVGLTNLSYLRMCILLCGILVILVLGLNSVYFNIEYIWLTYHKY